jgi:hypothetical protein
VLQSGQAFNPADIPRIIRRGKRESVFPTASTWTVSETVLYRIDNVAVRAGKIYLIQTSPLNIVPSVVNDVGVVRLRYNEAGAATTGSTMLAQMRKKQTETANTDTVPLITSYAPSADLTTVSFALTLARVVAGSSSSGVRLWGSVAEPMEIFITETGDDPGVSGTAF